MVQLVIGPYTVTDNDVLDESTNAVVFTAETFPLACSWAAMRHGERLMQLVEERALFNDPEFQLRVEETRKLTREELEKLGA